VPLDVRRDHRLQGLAKACRQRALFDQDLAERPALLRCPLRRRGDELVTVDQIHLQRQGAEEQVAIDARMVHRAGPVPVTCVRGNESSTSSGRYRYWSIPQPNDATARRELRKCHGSRAT
jgi:hypothetical protein